MANQNFRTALHGFNRDDVVQFIETKTLEHEKALRSKNDEITRLQGELDDKSSQLDAANAELSRLQEELTAKQEELAAKQDSPSAEAAPAAIEAPAAQSVPEPAESPLDAPIAPVAAELPQAPCAPRVSEMELAAYRRAELAERHAQERAAGVYQQIQAVFNQSSAKIVNTNQDLDTLTEALRTDLVRLQNTVSAMQKVYAEAAESFHAVGSGSFDE